MRKKTYTTELKTGDIVLFSGIERNSRLIKVCTNSKWSHVGLIIESQKHDFLTMWESSNRKGIEDVEAGEHREGVRLVSFHDRVNTFQGEISVRKLLGGMLTDENLSSLIEFKNELSGRPYERNKFELIKASNGLALRNKNEDLSSLFCSELVAEAYQRLGLLSEEKPSNGYAPVDFSHDRMKLLQRNFYLSEELEISINV